MSVPTAAAAAKPTATTQSATIAPLTAAQSVSASPAQATSKFDLKNREEIEQTAAANPLLFSDKSAGTIRFLRNIHRDLSKEDALLQIRAYCEARIRYHLQLEHLFLNGDDADIREFYESMDMQVLVLDKTFRCNRIKEEKYYRDIYEIALKFLDQGKYDQAFLHLYHEYNKNKKQFDDLSKSHMSYQYKKNGHETLYLLELINALRPYTSSSFFQKIENHYFLNKESRKAKVYVYNIDPNILILECNKARKEFVETCMTLVEGKGSFFSMRYKEIIFHAHQILVKQYNDLQNYLNEKLEKEPLQLGKPSFETQVKKFQEIDELKEAFISLKDTFNLNHRKISIFKALFTKYNKDNQDNMEAFKLNFEKLLEKYTKETDVSFKGYKEALAKEGQALMEAFLGLSAEFNKDLDKLFKVFDGGNLEDVSRAIDQYLEKINELKLRAQLFLEHQASLFNALKDKQQKKQVAHDNASKEQEAAQAKCVEEHQRAYEEKLKAHKQKIDAERAAKEKLKEEALARKKLEAQNAEAEKAKNADKKHVQETVQVSVLQKLLNPTQTALMDLIFSKPTPHHEIQYQAVVNLIEALGGRIVSEKGSHQHIKMLSLNNILGFIIYSDSVEQQNDGKSAKGTTSSAAAVATTAAATAAGTIVKPHKKGHNPGTLSRFAVEQFRGLLERVGFTVTAIPTISVAKAPTLQT